MSIWSPTTWQLKQCKQDISYLSLDKLDTVQTELHGLPPLVTSSECDHLKSLLAEAGEGKRFILQAGDCAERFSDCHETSIKSRLILLLKMCSLLSSNLSKPITPIGRIAGQYCKPRSQSFEIQGTQSLPCYRGDLVNSKEFNELARVADPQRLLQGYHYSKMTLSIIRKLLDYKDNSLPSTEPKASQKDSLDILQIANNISDFLNRNNFFICHEALNLHYEQTMTRQVGKDWYNLSTHMPWIGIRTNELELAHIEYIRGINNPIAIKIGHKMTPTWLCQLIKLLNPNNEPGKLNFITRFGIRHVEDCLPALIQAARETKIRVQWFCDPMHGNNIETQHNFKSRHFDDIVGELKLTAAIHYRYLSPLAGIHLEISPDPIAECLGGRINITEADLNQERYLSAVDPRLNREQALELATQFPGFLEHLHNSNLNQITSQSLI